MLLLDVVGADRSMLVFGAAPPGQRGKRHINCKLKKEWRGIVESYGWSYNKRATRIYRKELIAQGKKKGCYLKNTQCFIRKKEEIKNEDVG